MALQQNRNIPCMWDIFGAKPEDPGALGICDPAKSKLDSGSSYSDSTGNDSAISVGSASDEELYFNGSAATATVGTAKKKKRFGRKEAAAEPEVKYLERHLSMKKTIRKKIMRDLQKAFVEDPNEFRVDEGIPPEQLKAEINLQSLSFGPPSKQKDKKQAESNFLDFLRAGSGQHQQADAKGNGAGGAALKGAKSRAGGAAHGKDADGDSGHGSPATEESEEEDRKTSFWKRFTMKASRSKR